MKFYTENGVSAIDIPIELIQAQQNDNLVLFCGAGISYPAGLPLFDGLVNEVYGELRNKPSFQEQQAINQWRYDIALELLENRFNSEDRVDKHLVRKAIATRLTLKENANIETHQAILELAKTKQHRYRLVTTNVDNGFIVANKDTLKFSDAAPKLPIPKPHKWQSIVYLHGIINKELDPNSEQLIFTSGDFGTAYLTERWASRFVSELFRHFTVLFIGYSINDPVVRYITDAIAAERRRGDKQLIQPYILASAKQSDFNKVKLDWEEKGIIPLVYNRNRKHKQLHSTLKAWAAYCRDGLGSIERVIKQYAINPPHEPYDDEIKIVIDYLKNSDDAVKIFCSLSNPIASIDWLPLLEKEGLLSKSDIKQQHQITHNTQRDLMQPHPTTRMLWCWLIENYIESKQLIEWIIDKGANLHFEFIKIIQWSLHNKLPQEPYLTFRQIVVLKHHDYVSLNGFFDVANLKRNQDSLNLITLQKLFEPTIKLSKAFSWDNSETSIPYQAEVEINIYNLNPSEIKNINKIGILLLPMTNALKQAMELWKIIKQADNTFDRSYFDLVSISPHSQNQGFHNWVSLIEMCRDLWQITYQNNATFALIVIELWKTIPFPVFKRLVFHAYTQVNEITISDKLNYLLSDNHWWLWSHATNREKFRLLDLIALQLTAEELNILEQAIIAGVPREMLREDLYDAEWQDTNNHRVWLHLGKLESFGVTLSETAKKVYIDLSKKYPKWTLQEEERDEFSIWVSSSIGHECDLTCEELMNLSIEQRIEKSDEYFAGRMETFKLVCKDNPDFALKTLNFLANDSNWNASIWCSGLLALSEVENLLWIDIAKLVIQFPKTLFQKETWVITWWLEKSTKYIEANSDDEDYFWRIFDLLINYAEPVVIESNSMGIINSAINKPMGILTRALLNRFNIRNIKFNETILDKRLLSSINRLLDNNLLYAQVVLLSELRYFHAIDPEWTRLKLIPFLDWQANNNAVIFWQGYLWNARISVGLAVDLKESLLDTLLKHTKELGELSKKLIQVFILICFDYQNIYVVKQQREVLNHIGQEGLIEIARFINFQIMGKDTHKNDLYWKHRIKPFLKNVWSRESKALCSEIAQHLSSMCLKLDDEFEDAIKTIHPILTKVKDSDFILRQLKDSYHIEKHPVIIFNFMYDIIDSNNVPSWSLDVLRNISDSLIQKEPSLESSPKYQAIKEILRQKRFY